MTFLTAEPNEKLEDAPQKTNALISVAEIDTGAELAAGVSEELVPEEALRIRRKIDRHILPLMCTLYAIQFMDKTAIGSASIMGIREATHLTTDQLGTIFCVSYFIFQFPQNLCLQRFPVAKWLSFNILVWGAALMAHAACKNFVGLLIARFVLGTCEGSITSGFLIVTSMFYTRSEQTLRVGWWFLMNGAAIIVVSFVSVGTLHIRTGSFEPWQWLMVILGGVTVITALAFWLFFPDSPTTAWFLTKEERIKVFGSLTPNDFFVSHIHIRITKLGMIEALKDPKTWLFALFFCIGNIPNSLTIQRNIIITSFGFTVLQTLLLGCIDGVIEIVVIWTGVKIVSAYTAAIFTIPNIVGFFLIIFLPWNNKIGLLVGLWIMGFGTTTYVLVLSWISRVTAGHTKKITVNVIMFCAYCIGNALGPLMWKTEYQPRNTVPWTIIAMCYVIRMIIPLILRVMMDRENKRRDVEDRDITYDEVYIERPDEKGVVERVRVDKEFLDLTDIQNRDFRYVL
ncbi:hypothetical protein AN958_09446 [Leucoagaricus sp. SymC.cos]|nr:hypothetical protein AN958_09446 [Leucoagaricus sp. SymC.cos]